MDCYSHSELFPAASSWLLRWSSFYPRGGLSFLSALNPTEVTLSGWLPEPKGPSLRLLRYDPTHFPGATSVT